MSLRVWLPLNGDLRNLGCTNMKFTNSNAVINTSGKIGSCYSFNGSNAQIYAIHDKSIWNDKPISICMWYKFIAGNTTNCVVDIAADLCLSYVQNSSGLRFSYWRAYSNSSGNRVGDSNTISKYYDVNSWHHVVYVADHNLNEIYVDGIIASSFDSASKYTTNFKPLLGSGYNRITVGKSAGSSPFASGLVNDVRIYDHALSAAEVREISQGLILHYKLDNTPQGEIINAYNMSSWDTSTTRGGFNAWGPSGHAGTSGNNTDRQYIYRPDRTYSYYISENAGTGKYFIFYQSPAFSGGYRSLSAIIKEENSLPINETICTPGWNANVAGTGHAPINVWTRKISLGNGFYLCQVDGLYQDGSNDLVSIAVSPGYKIYISEIWLEDNKQVCSNVLFPIEYVEDSSGYNHNGEVLNTLSLVSDTPRYNACTYISATNQKIKISNFPTSGFGNSYSFSWWAKISSASPMHWGFSDGIRLNGMYTGRLWNTGDSSNNPLYKPGTTTQVDTPTVNVWHHWVMTGDGTTCKVYQDGIHWGTAKTYKAISGQTIYINGWDSGTGYSSNNYSISDFRIYCTALSADDVLALYHTGAKIDNKQNLHTFELNEINSNIFAGKMWSNSYGSHTPLTSPFINYNLNGEPQFTTNGTSAGSEYIKITPGTYEYDYTISVNTGNRFYIGIERYDANKTSRSNAACVYTTSIKPTADIVKQRYKGTVNLTTDGTNTIDTITLRILNGWSGTTSGVTGLATIHSFSLKLQSSGIDPSLKRTGQFTAGEFKEETNTKFYEDHIVEANEFIEL